MNVSEFMTKNVTTCSETSTVGDAANIMVEKSLSALPIVDSQDKLVGILTESDFVGKEKDVPHALVSIKNLFGQTFAFGDAEEIYKKVKSKTVSEVMTKNPTTVTPGETLNHVVSLMTARGLKRIPVVEEEKIVGIITRKDLIKAFSNL